MTDTTETPFTYPTLGTEAAKAMIDANLETMAKLQKRLETLQKDEIEKVRATITEGSALMQQSLDLWETAFTAWQKDAMTCSKQFSKTLSAAL